QQLRRVHVGRFLGIAAFRVVEVGRAAGDAEQVLLRLDLEQTEPLAVARPDELTRRRVAAHADTVGGLDQDRAARADLPDDLGIDRRVAAVLAVGPARVDVDHRGPGLPAASRRLADLVGLLGDHRAVAVLLHPAVEGDGDHDLVAFQHRLPLLFRCRFRADRTSGLSYRARTGHNATSRNRGRGPWLTAGESPTR